MLTHPSRRQLLAATVAGAALAGTSKALSHTASPQVPKLPSSDASDDARRLSFAQSLLDDGRRVVRRKISVRGHSFAYDTVLGALEIFDDAGEVSAIFVYFAYGRPDGGEGRPITFAWGGGPSGPSSLYHPLLGPRAQAEGKPHFEDNPDTLLDRTDLVMVDPVGTGWSMPAGGRDYTDFYSVRKDAASVAQFIQRYLVANNRPKAPVYLTGRSYGTIRLPVVLHFLKDTGTNLAGVYPVSAAMDGNAFWESSGNMAAYYLMIPNYAAIAWYHKRQATPAETVELAYQEGIDFAFDEYLPTLMKWPNVSTETKNRVLKRLHALTGIRPEIWAKYRLRIKGGDFSKEFLSEKGLVLPANDARRTRPVTAEGGSGLPATDRESPIDIYAREELDVRGAPFYRGIAPGLAEEGSKARNWVTDHRGVYPVGNFLVSALPNYLDDIAEAMKAHPKLRVQQHSGLYDLQCTSYPAEWSLANINLPDELRHNVKHINYAAGHSITDTPSERAKWVANVAAFYER